MRKALFELCLLLSAITCVHAVRIMRTGSINGKVFPSNPRQSVLATNGQDSVRAVSRNGNFRMRVDPGMWKVVVDYKTRSSANVIRENVEVNDGENINLGEIRLSE
jgi:hypothetical protein